MSEGKQRLLQAYETYNSLVDGKLEDFKRARQYLVEILEKLLKQGKISPRVIMASRTKSPTSVIENWKMGADLHDILGITLLTTDPKEMQEIESALTNDDRFNLVRKNDKREKRGYEAIHYVFDVENNGSKKTRVECHMQTHRAYENMYEHIFYKVRRKMGRDLTQEEEQQIAEKVQSMYEQGELAGDQLSGGKKSRLPQMWITSFNQQGKMEEQELDEDMILKIMYPLLDLSKKKKGVQGSQEPKPEVPDSEPEI